MGARPLTLNHLSLRNYKENTNEEITKGTFTADHEDHQAEYDSKQSLIVHGDIDDTLVAPSVQTGICCH